MIEIEYEILVKEDMYVSCVMCRSQSGPWTAWVLTAATSNGPTEHRSAEAAQEILKRRHIKAAARPATTTTHFKPIPSSRWGPEY